MTSTAKTPEEYLDSLPQDRKQIISEIRTQILNNLPTGFQETMAYGMLSYVVPHSIYPKGYHANPKQALPFISLASQKHHIALYHMGIYSDKNLLKWFVNEYNKQSKTKLDMGKSCIRFKKAEQIPYKLIGELVSKISVQEWIEKYERSMQK